MWRTIRAKIIPARTIPPREPAEGHPSWQLVPPRQQPRAKRFQRPISPTTHHQNPLSNSCRRCRAGAGVALRMASVDVRATPTDRLGDEVGDDENLASRTRGPHSLAGSANMGRRLVWYSCGTLSEEAGSRVARSGARLNRDLALSAALVRRPRFRSGAARWPEGVQGGGPFRARRGGNCCACRSRSPTSPPPRFRQIGPCAL